MASIEDTLATAMLAPAEIPAALKLSAEANWNQTAEDWAVFVAHGSVTGVFATGRRLVATAAILPYGRLGYIAMVLVAPAFRHRGIATRLLHDGIGELQAAGSTPMLDATPAGAAVYRPLGFRDVSGVTRWEGEGRAGAGSRLPRATAADAPRIAALDTEAFGADRSFLIASFLARRGTLAFLGDGGFVIRRKGFRADQIGPLVAPDEATAAALLAAALDAAPGPVFLDLFDRWEDLGRTLTGRGFSVQRSFTRMALGTKQPFGAPALLFVPAGPEFG